MSNYGNKSDYSHGNSAYGGTQPYSRRSQQGYLSKKMARMFGTSNEMKGVMLNGFKSGAILGGIIGMVFGVGLAVKSKSFAVIPLAMVTSAASFGFFMCIGATIRPNN
jgi:Reactive mitochondrial oxygen species modulator 1